MAVNYARLAFAHRMVANFYAHGFLPQARKVLENFGGMAYLQGVKNQLENDRDSEAENQLANLLFVWWQVTGDESARDQAEAIWSTMHEGEFGVHAAGMLARLARMDQSTPPAVLLARIAQLHRAQQETVDVDRANRLAELAEQLDQQFFRRCQK